MRTSDIDCSVCITLDRTPERWERFHSAPAWPFGVVERFAAIDGETIVVPEWWNGRPGHRAQCESHAAALQYCREKIGHHPSVRLDAAGPQDIIGPRRGKSGGDTCVLIFEDDALVPKDAAEQVERFLADVPDDWDMLYFGGTHYNPSAHPPEAVTENVMRIRSCQGSYAYAVRDTVIDSVVTCITSERQWCGSVGQRLEQLQRYPGLNVYAPWLWIVGHAANTSTIDGHEYQEQFFQPQDDILSRLRKQINGRVAV